MKKIALVILMTKVVTSNVIGMQNNLNAEQTYAGNLCVHPRDNESNFFKENIFTKEYFENISLHEAVELNFIDQVKNAFLRDQNQLNTPYVHPEIKNYEKNGYSPLDFALERYLLDVHHPNKDISEKAHFALKIAVFLIEKGGKFFRDEIYYFETVFKNENEVVSHGKTMRSVDLIEMIKKACEQKKIEDMILMLNK